MTEVFYYGLYMDPDVRDRVAAKGVGVDVARLDGWVMRLGDRSTLEREDGAATWGVVIDQSEDEIARLYTATSHRAYLRTPVRVVLRDAPRDVVTFIAPVNSIGAPDPNYAHALAGFCRKLAFPDAYVDGIASL
jgi:hypothetical protein